MIRILLDTNTIISGVFWQGAPRQVYQAVLQQEIKPLTSEALLLELERVLHYEKFVRPLTTLGTPPGAILDLYRTLADVVVPAEIPSDAVRDTQDIMVLACAVGGKADYIISGDKDLLTLGEYKGIPILSADQFIKQLSIE
jgi:uncharacterized protein